MNEYYDQPAKNCMGCQCKSPLFQLLSDDDLEILNAHKIHVNFKAGETIKKQGTFMSHVLSVNGGLAKLFIEGIEGHSSILRIVKPTSFIGGPGIFYDQRHHFTITALLESSVCFIDLQVFKNILHTNQVFAEAFLKDFSKDVLAVYNRLIYLTQKQMPGRMADALLYLCDEIFEKLKFPMLLQRSDLAELSAMSKESAMKILRDFQREGLLRISDHELEILNLEALRTISRIG